MPKKVLPTLEAFEEFERELLIRGFRRLSPSEFRQDRLRLDLKPPFPREGRELGYVYGRNGYTAVVWTTYLPRERMFRESDAGRVLIRDGDEVLYHAPPTHRTKNFFNNLLDRAKLARARVKNRPLCPKCEALMNIEKGKALKSRRWECRKPAHPRTVYLPWDHGLPQEALDIIKRQRKKRAKYYAKLRAAGKKPHTGLLSHKGWQVRRPKNVVHSQR